MTRLLRNTEGLRTVQRLRSGTIVQWSLIRGNTEARDTMSGLLQGNKYSVAALLVGSWNILLKPIGTHKINKRRIQP